MTQQDIKQWSKPVTFRIGPGTTFTVTNTEEAARYLVKRWPGETGPAQRAARETCLAVLAGIREPEDARTAFIIACEESEMEVVEFRRPRSK